MNWGDMKCYNRQVCKLPSKLKCQAARERAKSLPRSQCDLTSKSTVFFLLLFYHRLAHLNPTQIQVHVAGLVRIKESSHLAVYHGIQLTVLDMYVERTYALILTELEDNRKNLTFCPMREKALPIPESCNIVSLEPGCASN